MCFSASASFGAGIVLSTIGVASIKKTESSSRLFFACIPILFAIQQITEGFLWLALSNQNFQLFRWPTTYIFLVFAQVVWPFWVPFSIYKMEKKPKRKKALLFLIFIGFLVSCYLGYCLLSYPVDAKIDNFHIRYELDFPETLSKYGSILYIAATIAPPFLSAVRYMWTLGSAILISYLITELIYADYVISVWCFFASIISIVVLGIVWQLKRFEKPNVVLQA